MFHVISRLSIRGRITLIAATLLSLLIASSLMAVVSMYSIGNELKSITNEDIPLTEALTKVTIHQLEQAVHFERAVRFARQKDASSYTQGQKQEEVKKFKKLAVLVEQELADALQLTRAILSVPHSEAHDAEFREIAAGLEDVGRLHKVYDEHAYLVLQQLERGDYQAAERLAEKTVEEENQLDQKLSALVMRIESFTEKAAQAATAHEATAERNQILLFVFSALLSIVLCHQVAKVTQGHLNRVGRDLSTIAEGNLAGTIEGDDEINNPLRDMQTHLVQIIHTIQSAADSLGTTVAHVSATSYQTMNNIVEQQTQTESVASATAQMNATSQAVSQNIGATATAADEANQQAMSGQQVLEGAIDEVLDLARQIQDASLVISQLEQDTGNIGSVLAEISGIAEQTNLLALNAAIEAARAGEQGRGFAVVADEVRTLAARTQESTASIRETVEKLQAGSKRAVDVMGVSCDKSESVVGQVRDAGASLGSIVESIDRINVMSDQISTASAEQISVTDEIDRNVTEISSMGAENTKSTQAITDAMSEANTMSQELLAMVKRFRT